MCSMTRTVSIANFQPLDQTYPVKSVKEGVEQVGCGNLRRFIELVINLVESDGLWIDQGVAVKKRVSCLPVTGK